MFPAPRIPSARVSASCSEPGPSSAVVVTVKVAEGRVLVARTAGPNSDVSPDASEAVAVIQRPEATEFRMASKVMRPAASVVLVIERRNCAPSPNPEGSGAGLA